MLFIDFTVYKELTSPGFLEPHEKSLPLRRGTNRNCLFKKSSSSTKPRFYNLVLFLKCIIGSLFVLIFSSIPVFAQKSSFFNPKDAHYLWPTSASHALTSTFAETRAGHFHAALDIKTWGRRGFPVYATRAGEVYRLAIGPTGYGKVIYLKHDDGSYSLYAHLLRFNKQLQQLADSIRFRDYNPSFDIRVDSLHIHVRQGEKIALSGASGIGPPHLHFELRTPDEEPFNPLRTNLSVKDTLPPLFTGLAVEPLSMQTLIEGHNGIYTRRVINRTDDDQFGAIRVAGPVGLAVSVYDRANGVHNSYAAYKLTMKIDGRQVFQSTVNQFSYKNTHQMNIDRVYPLLKSTGRGYQRLYIADGNTLPFYKTDGNKGRLNLKPGRHHIIIQASDYFGNSRTAKVSLFVQKAFHQPLIYKRITPQDTALIIDPNEWHWFNNWVNIPADEFNRLTLAPLLHTVSHPLYDDHGRSVAVNLQASPQFYFHIQGQKHFISRRVYPSKAAYLTSPDNKAYASFPAGSFYDTTSVAFMRHGFTPDSVQISILPDNQPLAEGFTLSIKLDSLQKSDSTLSLYHYYPKRKRLRKLSAHRKGSYLTASASSLGSFLVLSDPVGPVLHKPRIFQRTDGQWLIYIPIKDNRSGIDYQNTQIFVNGVRGLTEYEPKDGRLVYYNPSFIPQSKNKIKITAYDMMGNKTVKTTVLPLERKP